MFFVLCTLFFVLCGLNFVLCASSRVRLYYFWFFSVGPRDLRSQNVSYRNFDLRISDSLGISDVKISDLRSQISDLRSQISDPGSQSSESDFSCRNLGSSDAGISEVKMSKSRKFGCRNLISSNLEDLEISDF